MPTVAALYVYPLKAAQGVRASASAVEARGLAGDRRWMLVDRDGRMISQRTHPRLACLRAEGGAEGLVIDAPGQAALNVAVPEPRAERLPVEVHGSVSEGALGPAEAHAWFSRFLEVDVRLVYQPADVRRSVNPAYGVAGDHVSFADGFPLLLTTTASLQSLNTRLEVPIPMNRFRPNVVVGGTEAFAEDQWRVVQIGAVRFRVVKPCKRCSVTTIDQATGEPTGAEPLRTLGRYRKQQGGVLFGQNLTPDVQGVIREGDAVEVLG